MKVVLVGHVDHGKSTLLGQLLAQTGTVSESRIDEIRERCKSSGQSFELAFLLDALQDERGQSVTIATSRSVIRYGGKEYFFYDAPGHEQFLRNLASGATQADVGVLLVDSLSGVTEVTKKHAFLLSLLDISRVAVVLNKLDLVGYQEERFNALRDSCKAELKELGVFPTTFIPVSAKVGDNLLTLSTNTPWYSGQTLMEFLSDTMEPGHTGPSRFLVQDFYKASEASSIRRIFVGPLFSGRLHTGSAIKIFPSGRLSSIAAIESWPTSGKHELLAGEQGGIVLDDDIYVRRGEVISSVDDSPPEVTSLLRARLFWLADHPLPLGSEFKFRIGSEEVTGRIRSVERVYFGASTPTVLQAGDVVEAILQLSAPVAMDPIGVSRALGRFALISQGVVSGGGVVVEPLVDDLTPWRAKRLLRDEKWEHSLISPAKRAERLGQRPQAVIITGSAAADKKLFAKTLEASLFTAGRFVYYVGMSNIVYGVSADVDRPSQEVIRRLAEVLYLQLDAGLIVIVTVTDLTEEDRLLLAALIGEENLLIAWYGEEKTTDLRVDVVVGSIRDIAGGVDRIRECLVERRAIYQPW